MPQVVFDTNSFSGAVVHATAMSELYYEHRNLCRMTALSPTERAQALSLVAKEILR